MNPATHVLIVSADPAWRQQLSDGLNQAAAKRDNPHGLVALPCECDGSALQAAVEIHCAGEKFDALASLGDDLKFVLICSSTVAIRDDAEQVIATPLEHAKCERCWHVRDDVGANVEHPGLCGRCVSNLHGAGEARAHA